MLGSADWRRPSAFGRLSPRGRLGPAGPRARAARWRSSSAVLGPCPSSVTKTRRRPRAARRTGESPRAAGKSCGARKAARRPLGAKRTLAGCPSPDGTDGGDAESPPADPLSLASRSTTRATANPATTTYSGLVVNRLMVWPKIPDLEVVAFNSDVYPANRTPILQHECLPPRAGMRLSGNYAHSSTEHACSCAAPRRQVRLYAPIRPAAKRRRRPRSPPPQIGQLVVDPLSVVHPANLHTLGSPPITDQGFARGARGVLARSVAERHFLTVSLPADAPVRAQACTDSQDEPLDSDWCSRTSTSSRTRGIIGTAVGAPSEGTARRPDPSPQHLQGRGKGPVHGRAARLHDACRMRP
jgi:hypothetical protein